MRKSFTYIICQPKDSKTDLIRSEKVFSKLDISIKGVGEFCKIPMHMVSKQSEIVIYRTTSPSCKYMFDYFQLDAFEGEEFSDFQILTFFDGVSIEFDQF